jgi:2Fe-2S ferredoxin
MTRAAVTFHVRRPGGEMREVLVPIGDRLMPALRGAGIPIEAICGGEMSCGTCHVLVDESYYGRLSPPQDDEQAMLDFLPSAVPGRSRLSCQIAVPLEADGCTIELPPA